MADYYNDRGWNAQGDRACGLLWHPSISPKMAKLGDRLFRFVYTGISAIVFFDKNCSIIRFDLYDTVNGYIALDKTWPKDSYYVAQISNRPEGLLVMNNDDQRNYEMALAKICYLAKQDKPIGYVGYYLYSEGDCLRAQ